MTSSMIAAMIATGALMVTTAYFIMGGIPLLILKHDTPLDARFVRGFFNVYYMAAFVTASATAIAYAFAGQWAVAAGAACLVGVAAMLRRLVIPKMAQLGDKISAGFMEAIPGFRTLHTAAILINITQLAVIVWCLITLSLQARAAG